MPIQERLRNAVAVAVASIAAAASCIFLMSCAGQRLEPYDLGAVQKTHAFGKVLLSGQPQPDDLEQARSRGLKTVISLRTDGELNWDEARIVRDLGMDYFVVGFRAPAELTDTVFDRVRELLGDRQRHPLLLHCASANRVGAVWLAHRVLDHGVDFDEAHREAEAVGLKSREYLARARDYVERRRESHATP